MGVGQQQQRRASLPPLILILLLFHVCVFVNHHGVLAVEYEGKSIEEKEHDTSFGNGGSGSCEREPKIVPKPALVACTGLDRALLGPGSFRLNVNGGGEGIEAVRSMAEKFEKLLLASKEKAEDMVGVGTRTASTAVTGGNRIGALDIEIRPGVSGIDCNDLAVDPRVEGYAITVDTKGARLTAACAYGLMRGIGTFHQLVVDAIEASFESGDSSVSLQHMRVEDKPRFAWRGLLVDTARHFFPIAALYRILDSMQAAKLNVFQWHIVDAQSFPYEIESLPHLSKCGAYDSTSVYTRDDVSNVINYAESVGIRVIVEIDVPGHAASWGKCDESLTLDCPKYAANVNNVALDVTNSEAIVSSTVSPVLSQALKDMRPKGKDYNEQFIHVGGDEISEGCLTTSKQFLRWNATHPNGSPAGVLNAFESRLIHEVSTKLGATPIFWDDVLSWYGPENLPQNSIINVWTSFREAERAIKDGFRVILSMPWYMDKSVFNCEAGSSTSCSTEEWSWVGQYKGMYLFEPVPSGSTDEEANLVIGGQAQMFDEFVDDDVVDGYLWPRTAFVAERLWSPADARDVDSASRRVSAFACRLKKMGVRSGPLNPGKPCRF